MAVCIRYVYMCVCVRESVLGKRCLCARISTISFIQITHSRSEETFVTETGSGRKGEQEMKMDGKLALCCWWPLNPMVLPNGRTRSWHTHTLTRRKCGYCFRPHSERMMSLETHGMLSQRRANRRERESQCPRERAFPCVAFRRCSARCEKCLTRVSVLMLTGSDRCVRGRSR